MKFSRSFPILSGRKLCRMVSLFVLILASSAIRADVFTSILNGEYNAKRMPQSLIDSLLNGKTEQRYTLMSENETTRFRHSKEADWYLLDSKKNRKLTIGRGREAQMSPNGKYVVYVKDRKPYIYKVDFATEVPFYQEDNKDIIAGASDWLYEEEFGITRTFAFSPDSKKVAYISINEAAVDSFAWQEYLNTEAEYLPYPRMQQLRYPKAGKSNPQAKVCVYDIADKTILTMQVNTSEDDYLPRITWRSLPDLKAKKGEKKDIYELIVEKINRDQNKLEVLACNPQSTVANVIYSESSDKYFIDYSLFDSWQWLQDGRFVVLSEKDGWRKLYLHASDGRQLSCLTPQDEDISCVYGADEAAQTVYYECAPTPLTRQACSVSFRKPSIVRMTGADGVHRLILSYDKKRAIDVFQNTSTPNQYILYNLNKGMLTGGKTVWNNDSIKQIWEAAGLANQEFTEIPVENGIKLNAWQVKPVNFDANKTYPTVIMQYSGPASQRVLNRWSKRFEYILADAGYVVFCIDTRGTDCRGRAFRNASYMQLGQVEAEDLVSAAAHIGSLPYVDAARMAIGGWSYGGFQTITTMTMPDSPFKCGFAVAPVTNWELYDSGYTERYMRRPQVNDTGYALTDLTRHAADLKGYLLIVHGLADDNVHAQNTLLFTDALVQAGKQFDMQLYIDDNHFLRKRGNYIHLHRKIMQFLKERL